MDRLKLKPVRTYLDGEAAKQRVRPAPRKLGGEFYRPKKRSSDGLFSKTLHVYRLRHSVTEQELRDVFEQYGQVDRVILYRPQFAYIVFRWVVDAMKAKEELDLTKRLPDGSSINVLLRSVQFVETKYGTETRKGKNPFDKIRIDFCLLPDELLEETVQPAVEKPVVTVEKPAVTIEDDFWDDTPFESPELQKVLTDDFYDDSVFNCPSVQQSLLCMPK